MTRLLVAMTLFGSLLLAMSVAAHNGFALTGRLGATDQEADEGYFAIDQQTVLVVKPGSELHAYLRKRSGTRVRITVEPDPEPE